MLKIIESVQQQECFECGEVKPIYAVQLVIHVDVKERDWLDQLCLPPAPDGKMWKPTCRECAAHHHEDDD
jgi:hypothetical protein